MNESDFPENIYNSKYETEENLQKLIIGQL